MSETEQSLSTDDESSVECPGRWRVLPPLSAEEVFAPTRYTDNTDLYINKWMQLLERAKNLFPERYEVTSFDPSIELVSYHVNGLGVSVIKDRVTLWPSILFALEEKQAGRK